MRSFTASCRFAMLLLAISSPLAGRCAPPAVEAPLRILSPALQRDGDVVVRPHEVWRLDGEDLLLGFIITAEIDTEGNVYLLDRWLSTVHVIAPDGQLRYQLGRKGEGPGEFDQPTDLTWLPGDRLGIVQPMPGRLVGLDLAGDPVGDLVPVSVSARAAQYGLLIEAAWRGGSLAYAGSRMSFQDGVMTRSSFLAYCDPETGEDLARVLQKETADDGRSEQAEADQYWIHEGRWCLGPQGRIFVASRRDAYAVEVYGPDGRLERTIGRDYEPRRRTDAEIDALCERLTRPAEEWGGGRVPRISATAPCIDELRVTDTGELWVRHGLSTRDRPEGVSATWDVFDAAGVFARTVSIAIEADPDVDRVIFLDDRHLLLIQGFREASDAMWGDAVGSEREDDGAIILYEIRP